MEKDLRCDHIHEYTDDELKQMTFVADDVDRLQPLRIVKGTDKASEFYSFWELASQDGCPVLLYSSRALDVLDEERRQLGPIKMTSGHRSIPWNQYVGGVPDSDHVLGNGWDHKSARGPVMQVHTLEVIDGTMNAIGLYKTFVHYGGHRVARWTG